MKNISSEKPKKKHKVITFMLIAAALTTAIVGTTVIAATLNKKADFSEVISGEKDALDVYSANDFIMKTDIENLDAEFLGIMGNEETAFAEIELFHKDGTAFFEDYDDYYEPEYKNHIDDIYYSNHFSTVDSYIAELFDEGTFTKNGDEYIANNLGCKYFEGALEIKNKDNNDITDDTSNNVIYVYDKETNRLKLYIQIKNNSNITDPDTSKKLTDLTGAS